MGFSSFVTSTVISLSPSLYLTVILTVFSSGVDVTLPFSPAITGDFTRIIGSNSDSSLISLCDAILASFVAVSSRRYSVVSSSFIIAFALASAS